MNPRAIRVFGYLFAWAALVVYAFILSPDSARSTGTVLDILPQIIASASNPDLNDPFAAVRMAFNPSSREVNGVANAVFNLLGIYPGFYLLMLLKDGPRLRGLRWVCVLGAFFFGMFSLMPYLALRRPDSELAPERNRVGLDVSAWILLVLAAGCVLLGASGDFAGFWKLFLENRFVNVMTVDLLLCTAYFPVLAAEYLRRAHTEPRRARWLVLISCVPAVGPGIFLVLRPKM